MSAPVVAVAMPTYNHAAFIGEAIESALAQTYEAWELIIVDDGSTDGTLDIVRRYRDPRIRVVPREHRGLGGLGESYRAVLGYSSAPLVAILEGDDRWPADKLARQVADFDDPDVVLSYGAGRLIDECGCEYGLVEPSFPRAIRTNRPTGAILPSLLSSNPILSPTVVVRRSALEAVGGFWQPDGVPYLDHPTWLLLAMQGAFAYHDATVGSWRRHSAQWTTREAQAGSGSIPEATYIGLIARRASREVGRLAAATPLNETLIREHADRAAVNRWRLALLSGGWRTIAKSGLGLVRSGRPRLIGLALLGVAMWGVGSDLEWVQRRRNRVAWPSRRHLRNHRCREQLLASGRGAPARR